MAFKQLMLNKLSSLGNGFPSLQDAKKKTVREWVIHQAFLLLHPAILLLLGTDLALENSVVGSADE